MIVPEVPGTWRYTASVMNGMNGCSSLSSAISTCLSTARVAAPFSPFRFTFASSIYQSQNSLQAKS